LVDNDVQQARHFPFFSNYFFFLILWPFMIIYLTRNWAMVGFHDSDFWVFHFLLLSDRLVLKRLTVTA
jgi:hypothetical protein